MRRYIHFILWVLILFLTINISAQRTPKDFIYFTDTINKSSGIDIVKVLNQGSDSIKNAELLNLTSLSETEEIHPQIPNTYNISKAGIVGDIPYNFDISTSGTTIINVMIDCPQSGSGFTPKISLVYNSMSDIGIVGYGWSIGGLSGIVRRNKTYYYDGITDGAPNMTTAYALDGETMKFINADGNFGYFQTVKSNVKLKTNPILGTWEALYPNGTKCYYGPNTVTTANILRQEDKAGNVIDYEYEAINKEFGEGHERIKRIKYSNSAEINFMYDISSNKMSKFFYGNKLMYAYRLSGIRVSYNDIDIAEYTFEYNYEKTLLSEIKKSVYDEEGSTYDLNSLQFKYGFMNNQTETFTINETQLNQFFEFNRPGDIIVNKGKFEYESENDGLAMYANKIPYYEIGNSGSGLFTNLYTGSEDIVLANMNGPLGSTCSTIKTDVGFIDLVCADIDDYKGDEVIKINNFICQNSFVNYIDFLSIKVYKKIQGAGFRLKYTREFDFKDISQIVDGSMYPNNHIIPKYFFVGDFNGDGKNELMLVSVAISGIDSRVIVFDLEGDEILYDGSPFNYNVKFPSNNVSGNDSYYDSDKLYVADYDSDGRADLYLINDQGINVYSFNNSVWVKISTDTKIKKENLKEKDVLLGDFNSDGKTDLMISPATDSGTDYWDIYLQKGAGWFEEVNSRITNKKRNSSYFSQDIDLDGQPDLVEVEAMIDDIFPTRPFPYQISVNFMRDCKPNGFIRLNNMWDTISVFPANHMSRDYFTSLMILNNHGILKKLVYNDRSDKARLLIGIIDSYGKITKIKYEPLVGGTYYIFPDEKAVFPYYNFAGGFWVGTKVQQYYNGKLYSDIDYKYTNGVVNRQGLGFCGFSKVEQHDRLFGKYSIQNFDPYRFGIKTSDSSDTQDNTYTYIINVDSKKRMQILLTGQTTVDKVKNITTTSSYTYDTYGSLISSDIQYGDNISKQQQIEYFNKVDDNTNIIGLPILTKEISVVGGDSWVNATAITYNDSYLPLTKKTYVNGDKLVKDELFEYDALNNLIKQSYRNYNSEWLSTQYAYQGRELISKTNEFEHTEIYAYKTLGVLESITDYKGYKTTYKYDPLLRRIETVYPDSLVEKSIISWNSGEPQDALYKVENISTINPTSRIYYNFLGQDIRSEQIRFDGSFLRTDKQYDIKGHLIKESLPSKTAPLLWNIYTYDDYDRILDKEYATGGTESYAYNGRSITSTIKGISTTRSYNSIGNMILSQDAGGSINYFYRPDGQLSSIETGNITTTFSYDEYGRQISIIDPSVGAKQFKYDVSGNINCETDARGEMIKSTYDKYNRVTKREYGMTFSVDYVYNEDSKLLSVVANNGKRTDYIYDEMSRLKEETEIISTAYHFKKRYQYSKGGIIDKIFYGQKNADIGVESYKYDNGHLTEISFNDSIDIWKLGSEDNRGFTTQITTGPIYRNYSYDIQGNVKSRFSYLPGADIQLYSYEYSPSTGNMISRNDQMRGLGSESFQYDNLNRLVRYGNNTIEYASNGNIINKTNIGSFSYSSIKPYAIENMTPSGDLIPLHNQLIKYNALNLPDSITENSRLAVFKYNGNGKRAEMKIGSGRAYMLQRMYFSDCFEMEFFTKNASTKNTRRLYLGGDCYSAPAVLIQKNNKWSIHYILRDNLGSVTHVTDSEGTVLQELSYDAWGNLRNPDTHELYTEDNEPDLIIGRGFTGHEHLQKYRLINMNGRLYDPAIGRFLSPDPYVQMPDFTQNLNRYSYCLNNPLVYTDPSGKFIFTALLPGIGVFLDSACYGMVFNMALGGFRSLMDGKSFLSGAWRGAISGAVGGFLSPMGGAGLSFGADLALGVLQGGFVGGLDALLFGNNVGKGILYGALSGAVMTTLTSEYVSNLCKGKGFNSNETIFQRFKSEEYMTPNGSSWEKEALKYFGFKAEYDPFLEIGGNYSPVEDQIKIGPAAFESYDKFAFIYDHEVKHKSDIISGKIKANEEAFTTEFAAIEWRTHAYSFANQGKYPNHGYAIKGALKDFESIATNIFGTPLSLFKEGYINFKFEQLYRIPRRW